MDKSSYVKGNHDEIIKRFSQIYSIRMRFPINDSSIKNVRDLLNSFLNEYLKENGSFENVPSIDVFNIIMRSLNFCKINNINADKIYVIIGCIQSFKNLKYISIDFNDDKELDDAYINIQNNKNNDDDKVKILKKIYDILSMEINLSSLFSQDIIDLFNKCLMHNGLINNSYLKREFYINFDYDGYVAFMDMFLSNNAILFESVDKNIIDYFRMFPVFVANQKPDILIITNYKDI